LKKRVLIAQADPVAAAQFRQSIEHSDDLALVAIVPTALQALAEIRRGGLDYCVIDLNLQDGSALDVVQYAAGLLPTLPVLICTRLDDEQSVIAAIDAGACGYVLKSTSDLDIAQHLRVMIEGGASLSPPVARLLLTLWRASETETTAPENTRTSSPSSARSIPPLSTREREVLVLVSQGASYAEVAKSLSISIETVSVHLRRTYRKLSVHSRSQAVYRAAQLGIIKVH
jgi:DNA-binding NarL/FixJ family response regulator